MQTLERLRDEKEPVDPPRRGGPEGLIRQLELQTEDSTTEARAYSRTDAAKAEGAREAFSLAAKLARFHLRGEEFPDVKPAAE